MKTKVMSIIGIRPDFIRMSEIIKGLDKAEDIEHSLIHTGQHYSRAMDGVFFDELGIREPDANLSVGSGTHGEQTGRLVMAAERTISTERPHVCVFLGDSNASLSAIAAAKLNVKVIHIEAGMRSFDRRMPEEKNRRMVDQISDYLFVYTQRYRENLLLEGFASERVFVVGNPIVDIVNLYRSSADRSNAVGAAGLEPGRYILATLHREENVDNPAVLEDLLHGLDLIARQTGLLVYYPMSYRTSTRIKEFSLELPSTIRATEPLGFLDFLSLEMKAALIVTDSGTVQEEASILQVPCIVARWSTERPETVEVGGCIVSGCLPNDMLEAATVMLQRQRDWRHILGDGKSSQRIVDIIVRLGPELRSDRFTPPIADERRRASFSPYIDHMTSR
jgi:UDP-N-acetylglucosamine 2-epimerase (non-hydrolysing)